jgi:hypothetical protein
MKKILLSITKTTQLDYLNAYQQNNLHTLYSFMFTMLQINRQNSLHSL